MTGDQRMLTIMVGETEVYDETTNEFSYGGGTKVDFEHSLVSLSKWESEYERPFLNGADRTADEMLFYIRCMILSPEVSPDIVNQLSEENLKEIGQYVEAKRSATTFVETPSRAREETITSELIYYWMSPFRSQSPVRHGI
jgi:hypothetical protein